MALTAPEHVAAFKKSFFIHKSIREFKHNKDDPTFLKDQRLRLVTYDAKKGHNQEQSKITGKQDRTTTPLSMAPLQAKSSPRIHTPPVAPVHPHPTKLPPAPRTNAGPGPNAIATSGNPPLVPIPLPDNQKKSKDSTARPGAVRNPPNKKFGDIEKSESESESESGSESKSDSDSDCEQPPPRYFKPVVLMTTRVGVKKPVKVRHPEVSTDVKQEKVAWIVPTGEFYNPPCSRC